jgi:hypothetical protein
VGIRKREVLNGAGWNDMQHADRQRERGRERQEPDL